MLSGDFYVVFEEIRYTFEDKTGCIGSFGRIKLPVFTEWNAEDVI